MSKFDTGIEAWRRYAMHSNYPGMLSVLTLIFLFLPRGVVAGDPRAVVLAVGGVVPGTGGRPLHPGQVLEAGETIDLPPETSCVLMLPEDQPLSLAGPTAYTVPREGAGDPS